MGESTTTELIVAAPEAARSSVTSGRDVGRVVVAAAAIGAGLIHAAAVGPHAGHGIVSGLFAVAAVVGVGSGVAVLVRPTRPVLVAVAIAQAVMLATWVASRTTGVAFVSGLEEAESIGFPDGVAAAFELVVVLGSLALCRRPRRASRLPTRVAPVAMIPVALAVALVAGPAVYVGATSEHGHGGGTTVETADGHGHSHDGSAGADPGPETVAATTDDHEHPEVAAKPFDPAAPVDLSGTPGITQVQQQEAELLLARTLEQLPAFAEQSAANAAGYWSIGDSSTGDEHLINWDAINDEHVLDPARPESLVYNTRNGAPELEAAMFILPDGFTLENVPAIGGSLIQWHIHDDLCFTQGSPPVLAGLRAPNGPCSPGEVAFRPNPMIHVWISENPCGPFSALEGIGAGTTKSGQRDCDHAHGSERAPGSSF